MNFRGFLLILGVFLSVLSICCVEDPEASSEPKSSSNDQTNSIYSTEAKEVNLNDDSSKSSSSSHTMSPLTPPYSSLNTDSSTKSLYSLSSDKSISSSELEQLVLQRVAPATPHYDSESVTSSLSVIASATDSLHQEKKNAVEGDRPHPSVVLVSTINSEKQEVNYKEDKVRDLEVESKEKEANKDGFIPDKLQETQSIVENAEPFMEKQNTENSSPSVSTKDNEQELTDKENESKSKEDEPKDKDELREKEGDMVKDEVKDKRDEDEMKGNEADDKEKEVKEKEYEADGKDDDSITAGLKQAEEETKPAAEEMPSFDEFKRQHLQEEEKQKNILKQQQEIKIGPETLSKTKARKAKQRKQNNYASLDCGAKILKANPEASNIFSILQDNRDLYMLNPCSAKIWFIVELCDNVQVKTIEIANFELFSSTPESFKVYVSGRYPTREWTLLGTFQARSERNLQSFPLDEPIYAKYIKVEMLSHFGSEHYCPLSLFRVFGTSMMEELEDHEADGQDDGDDGDAVDPDDDTSQVLPPEPLVKADDHKTKTTSNILATVGDTLYNIVKVAAKKLTGVTDDGDDKLGSVSLGVSTVAPSSGIVSSMTSKGQETKFSIVTLIPSEDDDEKIRDFKQENKTANITVKPESKKPDKQKMDGEKNTFYDKIDSDNSKGSKTTSALTNCELLVRVLGHSSFGCMMGKILYSKRKHGGFTPREESSKSTNRQKSSARNVKVAPGSDRQVDTNTDKGKEDSKKNEEKKEGEKESEKVEEKGKKNGKEKIDNGNEKPVEEKEENENGIISKSMNKINGKESSIETKNLSDKPGGEESITDVPTSSIPPAIDPTSIVQPSEVEQPIIKPCDAKSEEKGTPVLTSVSVLTSSPSKENTDSEWTETTTTDVEPTLNQVEKSNNELPVREKTIDDVEKNTSDVKEGIDLSEQARTEADEVKATTVESEVTKREIPEVKPGSTVEQSTSDTCASVDSDDKSLIKSSQSKPSECVAPTVITHSKDVDVLEFKLLDSTGREGTAHPEKPVAPDKPVVPVKPDKPVGVEDPIKESESTPQSGNKPSIQDTHVKESTEQKDEPAVSASSSSLEPSKPNVVVIPFTPSEPQVPEQPTKPPGVKDSEPESVSPLHPPPVDKVPTAQPQMDKAPDAPPPVNEVPAAQPLMDKLHTVPAPADNVPTVPSSSTEASLTDDISSVLSRASSTAGGQGLGSSGAQKESIFMRLTNRIKALEQNLTLSTLYMEKLNQKYRKIVEEMQKNFDKKVNLLTNATRKAEAVIRSQKEQISNLQSKMDDTSRDMKQFNKKLENLNVQVMERHIIGLFLEVILIMILFIVFRRWDRARIRRDILRDSRTNGTVAASYNHSSHTEEKALGKIPNGQLSARQQLHRSFSNPNENIGTFTESVVHRHKEEFFPSMDVKKKRNRKRPKSGIITSESSQNNTDTSPDTPNQQSQSNLVSVTAGLLFSPARGLLNGFKRSQSLDETQIHRKTSLPSTSKLQKTKSLNVIHENLDKISFSVANSKKGRIPSPPPPPSPQRSWTGGSVNGFYQKRLPGQTPSSMKLAQKKGGRVLNGANPYA